MKYIISFLLLSQYVYAQGTQEAKQLANSVNKFVAVAKHQGREQLRSELLYKGILLKHTPGTNRALLDSLGVHGNDDKALLWGVLEEEKHRPTGGKPETLKVIKDLVMIPGLNGGRLGYLCRYEVERKSGLIGEDIYYNEIDEKGKWKK